MVLFLLLIALIANAQIIWKTGATHIHIDPEVSDDGDGSIDTPYKTIMSAYDNSLKIN